MVEFRSDIKVELIQQMGDDEMVCKAARVSTGKDQDPQDKIKGLINYLAKNRHTSPFEHTAATFRIEAPVFVSRQAMRHRVFSYNEISGRYAKMPPTFYVIPDDRPVVNDGTGANPRLVQGTPHQVRFAQASEVRVANFAWREYEAQLAEGIATEVARNVLPSGMYTAWYVTGNLHGWFNFLSLRTADNALEEIRHVADDIERQLTEIFPITMVAAREHML